MFSHDEWINQLEKQKRLEEESVSLGKARFNRRIEEARKKDHGSTVGAVRKFLTEAIEPVEQGIQWHIAKQEGQPGRNHVALSWLRSQVDYPVGVSPKMAERSHEDGKLGADVAAYLTSYVILNGIHQREQDHRDTALEIVKLLIHELRYRRFKSRAPALFEYRMNRFDTTSYAHRSRSLNAALSIAQCDACRGVIPEGEFCEHLDMGDLDLHTRTRLLVGIWLLDRFIESTGLVETKLVTKYRQGKADRRLHIVPAEGTMEWLESRHEAMESLWPVKMPMLVPPLPWREGDRGGYRFSLRGRFGLVRADRKHRRFVEEHRMPIVRSALNRLQDVGWKINPDAYWLLQQIEERGGGMGGVPTLERLEMPTLEQTLARLKFEDPETFGPVRIVEERVDAPEDIRKAVIWNLRKSRSEAHDENFQRSLDEEMYRKTRRVAKRLKEEPVFFFPYNLDFRGRIYPISDYLTPQGTDIEKGLLSFADERPMGVMGGKWLAIHIMNCMDETPGGQKVSKMTLIERQAWVEDHEDLILEIARDPFGDTWWLASEDPVQLYAACRDWLRWHEAGYATSYRSGIVVGQDGSCNGLQHFSAMFRDEVGGRAVNVLPSETPQDVYDLVAKAVLDLVEADYSAGDELAGKVLAYPGKPLVDRKTCKRPTMTFPYGSKTFGFTEQLAEYFRPDGKRDKSEGDCHEIEEHFSSVNTETGEMQSGLFEMCNYLANKIWEALDRVVESAKDGMDWMQECARTITEDNEPVKWTVPVTGFPVIQQYYISTRKRVETVLCGRLQSSYRETSDSVQRYKQTNAVAPNVIHSLDAAALMLTVAAAADEGIEAFGMVHDSYATTPGDSEVLAQVTRQQFLRLYQEDVAAELWEGWMEQTEQEVPEPPKLGNLDLGAVLVSPYFFA